MAAPAEAPPARTPRAPPVVLEARALTRTFGAGPEATHALRGASLSLSAGELVAIQGRSGSGKTTFLNLVSGLDAADEGAVRLLGQDLGGLSTKERLALRAREVGFVFQKPALLPELRLWENVAIAARIADVPAGEARERAIEALGAVGLEGLEARFPGEVSGGEAQRASVARALVKGPSLLLADEPTANLDHETAHLVARVFRAFVSDGRAAALVVTHDDVMAGAADRRYLLREGRMEARES